MNTEDSEFERIEREQVMRNVPDAIHHTDTSESLEYITGWNDCRAAMMAKLAEQPEHHDPIGDAQDKLIAEQGAQPAQKRPQNCGTGYCSCIECVMEPAQQEPLTGGDERRHIICLCPDCTKPAQQEPVAWWDAKLGVFDEKHFDQLQPLYTSPPAQRKPLNVAEVEQILAQHNYEIHGDRARYIVRMTEAAHGIKENT